MKKNKLIKLFGVACLGLMAVDAVLDIVCLVREARTEDGCDGCDGCLGCCFEDDPANDRGVVKDACGCASSEGSASEPKCDGCSASTSESAGQGEA